MEDHPKNYDYGEDHEQREDPLGFGHGVHHACARCRRTSRHTRIHPARRGWSHTLSFAFTLMADALRRSVDSDWGDIPGWLFEYRASCRLLDIFLKLPEDPDGDE